MEGLSANKPSLAILIPVKNEDISILVNALHLQCKKADIHYSIYIGDDASDAKFQHVFTELSSHPKVFVLRNDLPKGRSHNRNNLARNALADFLLFIDADSRINEWYISNYIRLFEQKSVVIGGTLYAKNPPEKSKLLRWIYGRKREQKSAKERNIKPYSALTANNMLLPKKVFELVQFDETIRGYGHEDTLFGISLKSKYIPLIHTDNPVEHLGLESNNEFLAKTQEGITTLVHLYKNKKLIDNEVSLIEYYKKLKIVGFFIFCSPFKNRLLRFAENKCQSIGSEKELFWFDLYKLLYLSILLD